MRLDVTGLDGLSSCRGGRKHRAVMAYTVKRGGTMTVLKTPEVAMQYCLQRYTALYDLNLHRSASRTPRQGLTQSGSHCPTGSLLLRRAHFSSPPFLPPSPKHRPPRGPPGPRRVTSPPGTIASPSANPGLSCHQVHPWDPQHLVSVSLP